MKAKLMLIVLGCLLIFSVVVVLNTNCQKSKSYDSYTEDPSNSISQEESSLDESNVESNNHDIPDLQENNITKNEEQSKTETNTQSKAQTNTSNSNTNQNNISQSKNDNENSKPNETTKSKTEDESKNTTQVCSINNSNFIKYLNNWKAQNPYSLVFYSQDKLDAYINKATRTYGYGAWKSSVPINYKDGDCTISFYNAMLYIPKTSCVDSNGNNNDQMYIKATSEENLINKYQYLTNMGYTCEGKTW